MDCPCCGESCGRKLWGEQQWSARDPYMNDWLWTCRVCAVAKPINHRWARYHCKRFMQYMQSAFHFGLYAAMFSYRAVHRNSYHQKHHNNAAFNFGHANGALMANCVLGRVSSRSYDTYYGGGRFFESFIGFLRDSPDNQHLVTMVEAATWHLQLGSYSLPF